MKKTLLKLSLFLSIIAISFSCKKLLDKALTFHYTEQADFSIPATTIVGGLPKINTPEISNNIDKEFEKNDADINKLKAVKISKLVLNINTPVTQNFDFLNSISIYISADGLGEQLIASKENIPNGSDKSIELETSGANLLEYFKQDKYKLSISAKTDETIPQDVDMTSDITFSVTAAPLN